MQRTCPLNGKGASASSIREERQLAPTEINFTCTASKSSAVLKVPGYIGTTPVEFLVDSGAAVSVVRMDAIPASSYSHINYVSDVTAVSASGHSLDIIGKAVLPLTIGHVKCKQEFTIVHNLTVECLLGVDFLIGNQGTIDCVRKCLTLASEEIPFNSADNISYDEPNGTKIPVTVLETVEIQSRSIQYIAAHLHATPISYTSREGLVEPLKSPTTPKHLAIARSLNTVDATNGVVVQVMNISPGNITLCKGTPLGEFIPIFNVCVVEDNQGRRMNL